MWIKRWKLALTKVWTILVGFMLGFQNISDFSESFSNKRNSQKNELGMCQGQPQRGEMFIEMPPLQGLSPSGAKCVSHLNNLKLSKV